MQTIRKHKIVMLVLCVVLVLGAWMSISQAETTKKYEYVVGPQQTDMGRMIQAYENLSSQYLTLVQQNLTLMAQRDQQMLTKMSSMEKKIDQLNAKVDELQKQLKQKTSPDGEKLDKQLKDMGF